MSARLAARLVAERHGKRYFAVNPGGVTVVHTLFNTFACLTCLTADRCPHAAAAREGADAPPAQENVA